MPVRREETIRTDPALGDAAYEAAVVRFRSGDLDGALAEGRLALDAVPDHGPAHHLMGLLRYNTGDPERALDHLDRAAAAMPASAEVQAVRARILGLLGRVPEALRSHARALELAPESVAVLNAYGEFLRQHGKPAEAMTLFSHALKLAPRDPEALRGAGHAFNELGRSGQALRCFRLSLVGDPDNAPVRASMGHVLTHRGEREAAAACYREALAIDPGLPAAHLGLANTQSGPPAPGWIETLRALDRADIPLHDRVDLHFALAKCLDRADRPDEAIAVYVEANAMREGITGGPFDLERVEAETAARIATCDRTYFEERAGWGVDDPRPVFVVGMPRSGTTLVESILGGHPECHAAGELPLLEEARLGIEGMGETAVPVGGLPSRWRGLTGDDVEAAARRHLARLEALAPDAPRIVDKMPHNYRTLWLAALMLPRARVIHVRRDPRDTCLSIFTQVFRKSHAYKNDLRTLGRYYLDYQRLTEHWAKVLPEPPLEVRYEELVADPEGVARRMVDHCGLDWHPGCLEYHAQHRSVLTASALQVREKVYGSSVGRWKRYASGLGPLLEALGPIDD